MKTINKWLVVLLLASAFGGCNKFLDQDPDKVLSDDQVFSDPVLIKSVLANFYGRVTWGQNISDSKPYTILDEAGKSDGGPDNMTTYADDLWRVYDYGLIRNINEFLRDLRASKALDGQELKSYEGEARFLRAWTYFNMCRGLGGMPIVGDDVFDYDTIKTGMVQLARATEAGLYDYIISECDAVGAFLPEEPSINSARATKWAALMLKARAAIYAGSIANYNNKMATPIRTAGGEVGIPADRAAGYYQQALTAAREVINSGHYSLQLNKPDDLARNFYEAVCAKDNNREVIWARDYVYPGQTTQFTTANVPPSVAEDIDRAYAGPLLNLVDDYEYTNNRNGEIKTKDAQGNYLFYDSPLDAFADKDARLAGTVILPGSEFKGDAIVLQAGEKSMEGGAWKNLFGSPGVTVGGRVITSQNGPVTSNVQYINKTGFFIRKFLDEAQGSSTRGKGSAMWFPRFRFAEAVLIACEASFELGKQADALTYINQVRARGGIQPLATITFNDIVRENRVEFALEDHRYWDLKRWRLADKIWNGVNSNPKAMQYALFPYLVNAPGNPNNGKWVFDRQLFGNAPNPRFFRLQNYYNFLDQAWLNNNPKLVRNPFQ